jgi:hypothetical protein
MHYPNPQTRARMIALNRNAKEFARNLPLVGFGSGSNPGREYADRVDEVSWLTDTVRLAAS